MTPIPEPKNNLEAQELDDLKNLILDNTDPFNAPKTLEQTARAFFAWHKAEMDKATQAVKFQYLTDLARAVGVLEGLGYPDRLLKQRFDDLQVELDQ